MLEQNYKIPLVWSIFINVIFIGAVAYSMHNMDSHNTKYNDVVVAIDMSKYEIADKTNKQIKPSVDMNKKSSNGGKSGTILRDLTGKSTEGLKDLNPYLGGHENATVNVAGDFSNSIGNPGETDTPGPGGGSNQGNLGNGDEGNGHDAGEPADVPSEMSGFYDAGSYHARLESNKVMPQQAVRRNLTGIVSFEVTFDENGNFIGAIMTGSSGHSILDNAATRLVSSSGGIENTTGHSVTISIRVVYNWD